MERLLAEKTSKQKVATIADSIFVAQQRANADAEFYAASKRTSANELRLTDEFLRKARVEALLNSTVIHHGEKVPSTIITGAAAGFVPVPTRSRST